MKDDRKAEGPLIITVMHGLTGGYIFKSEVIPTPEIATIPL